MGVERTFQTHSPQIESVVVKRRGDVRQAKLYYLRALSGRKARIREKLAKASSAPLVPETGEAPAADEIAASAESVSAEMEAPAGEDKQD